MASILKTMRPPFLLLSPICVLLGLGTASLGSEKVELSVFFLTLLGAIFAHISVNMINEYCDFKSGLDFKTKKTVFSGGSGALIESPQAASIVLLAGLFFLLVTIGIGLYFITLHGVRIFPIGFAGVILIITYTSWLNTKPWLCLIAPGIGFGFLMVVGTDVMLTGRYSLLPWLVSFFPFFLINNLLLLNQYPDIQADASIGRKTFPHVFGVNKSNVIYAVFSIAAALTIVLLILGDFVPLVSIVSLFSIAFSLVAILGATKYKAKISQAPLYLAANVFAALLGPFLLAIALLFRG